MLLLKSRSRREAVTLVGSIEVAGEDLDGRLLADVVLAKVVLAQQQLAQQVHIPLPHLEVLGQYACLFTVNMYQSTHHSCV